MLEKNVPDPDLLKSDVSVKGEFTLTESFVP